MIHPPFSVIFSYPTIGIRADCFSVSLTTGSLWLFMMDKKSEFLNMDYLDLMGITIPFGVLGWRCFCSLKELMFVKLCWMNTKIQQLFQQIPQVKNIWK